MAESSSRRRRQRRKDSRRQDRNRRMADDASPRTDPYSSTRKHRRPKPTPPPPPAGDSPPSYSVEENSEGEWVNSRLNVKWPQQVHNSLVNKHRYLTLADDDEADADSASDRRQVERRSRKRRDKERKEREKREKERRDKERSKKEKKKSARSAPLAKAEKDPQYITLSTGSEQEESDRIKQRARRERMCIQTSPQVSKKSHHGGFVTDEDAKKIDSVVFDTKSEMMRYRKSDDILPSRRSIAAARKKSAAAEQLVNEEYNRFYVGVRSRRGVEGKLKRPGEFALYYVKPNPDSDEVPPTIPLYIAYLSSESQPYHFPIRCFEGADGHKHYVVMQNKSDGKMFTSILSLVKHYALYSHVDTRSGRLETFSVSH